MACAPYVVRLTGDGTGALSNPEAIYLGVAQYLGSGTLDMLALMRRPDGNPAPLLVLQHAVGSFGRELCLSYELNPDQLVCDTAPVQGPLAVGDINGTYAGVPPDEVVTSAGGALMRVFGFTSPPLTWGDSTRSVPVTQLGQASVESAAMGDLDDDGDIDVLVGQPVNSLSPRVASIHYFLWDPVGSGGLEQVPHPCSRRRAWTRWPSRTWTRTGATTWSPPASTARGWCTSATGRAASTVARTCHRSGTRIRPPPHE